MELRNIAIIAHVDHGKTTLVDALLKQSASFKQKSGAINELIMDTNELERERGITIFSKNAAIIYNDIKINIVDTPGHADFGGEVERIMRMVDGALLLVDAKEGPMPQTKFVLKKAIQAGLKIIVVINKIDKPDARPMWALERTFDLFVDLGASEEQADFPVIYASGVNGKAGYNHNLSEMKNISPLFDAIIKYIPPPKVDLSKPLQMLTFSLLQDNFKGKIAVGRIYSGTLKKGMEVGYINRAGALKKAYLSSVMAFDGLNRVETEVSTPGDIVAIAGIPDISIGETITDFNNPQPLPPISIDEPTVKINFLVNDSPFAGKEGTYSTSINLRDRLKRELDTDVALRVESTDSPDRWIVSGRGELHLSILIEKMRHEGYEFQVSRPQVILHETDGKKTEPIERLSIEVPETYTGTVIEQVGSRKGLMVDMRVDKGTAYLEFLIPTRGLIGFRNQFMTSTKGLGIMNSIFEKYEDYKGDFDSNPHGSLVASETGATRTYGLLNAEGRGELFVGPGVKVYEGMIVGQNAKTNDIRVNVCKEKQLSNMRAKSDGAMEFLKVPRTLTLEEAIEFIGNDELVEITPQSIRLRKLWLKEGDENRSKRGLL
ncbi:MAG: translational GTPase TypA [Patescibacteria group bacterium]|nr:translational GTPase TypA [Patescibacteria group bacterium]MCL5224184.1 translational GTPase TypA [Patescibacteria group bacterium]